MWHFSRHRKTPDIVVAQIIFIFVHAAYRKTIKPRRHTVGQKNYTAKNKHNGSPQEMKIPTWTISLTNLEVDILGSSMVKSLRPARLPTYSFPSFFDTYMTCMYTYILPRFLFWDKAFQILTNLACKTCKAGAWFTRSLPQSQGIRACLHLSVPLAIYPAPHRTALVELNPDQNPDTVVWLLSMRHHLKYSAWWPYPRQSSAEATPLVAWLQTKRTLVIDRLGIQYYCNVLCSREGIRKIYSLRQGWTWPRVMILCIEGKRNQFHPLQRINNRAIWTRHSHLNFSISPGHVTVLVSWRKKCSFYTTNLICKCRGILVELSKPPYVPASWKRENPRLFVVIC